MDSNPYFFFIKWFKS